MFDAFASLACSLLYLSDSGSDSFRSVHVFFFNLIFPFSLSLLFFIPPNQDYFMCCITLMLQVVIKTFVSSTAPMCEQATSIRPFYSTCNLISTVYLGRFLIQIGHRKAKTNAMFVFRLGILNLISG
ncbi:hypothetical protein Bca4012_015515 [Brassica carinata]